MSCRASTTSGQHYGKCADGKNDPRAGCVGTVQNWKDISPASRRARRLRRWPDGGEGERARAMWPASRSRWPTTSTRFGVEYHGPSSLDERYRSERVAARETATIQFNELGTSTATRRRSAGTCRRPRRPGGAERLVQACNNIEYTSRAASDRPAHVVEWWLVPPAFGNQTFTNDLRFDKSSYDGPFCVNAPSDPLLPGGGGYAVCNLYDLKPSVFALGLPANNQVTFSKNFGGETNVYQGYDINLESRFANGAFLRGGVTAGTRTFDNCNLLEAGYDAVSGGALVNSEQYADGTSYCHREYPYRPDVNSRVVPLPLVSSQRHVSVQPRHPEAGPAGDSASWGSRERAVRSTGTIGSTLAAT